VALIVVSSAKVAVREPGDAGRLQYISGIRADPILCLVVHLHLWISVQNIHFQSSPGNVGYGDGILGEGSNSGGESAVGLYATLYRMPGRCRVSRASCIR
jgi:hypothetical protein